MLNMGQMCICGRRTGVRAIEDVIIISKHAYGLIRTEEIDVMIASIVA